MTTITTLLTIPAFARATGLTPTLARTLVNRGDIPSVRVGSRRRVDIRFVERWTAAACQLPDTGAPCQPSL